MYKTITLKNGKEVLADVQRFRDDKNEITLSAEDRKGNYYEPEGSDDLGLIWHKVKR